MKNSFFLFYLNHLSNSSYIYLYSTSNKSFSQDEKIKLEDYLEILEKFIADKGLICYTIGKLYV